MTCQPVAAVACAQRICPVALRRRLDTAVVGAAAHQWRQVVAAAQDDGWQHAPVQLLLQLSRHHRRACCRPHPAAAQRPAQENEPTAAMERARAPTVAALQAGLLLPVRAGTPQQHPASTGCAALCSEVLPAGLAEG